MPKLVRTPQILVSVELGNPTVDCAHFGICSLSVLSLKQWSVFKPRHVRHAKAMLSITPTGYLRFEFPLEGLRTDTRTQFFPSEGFRMDSATVLPKPVVTSLQLSLGARLIPGIYGLILFTDSIVVELSIKAADQAFAAAA